MLQVLIVGLDGATWRLLEPWVREQRLPHLTALMERSTWGSLRSTVPALTLPAWSSFMTGRNPGGHGIFSFRRLVPDGYGAGGLANATDLRSATLWDVAGRAGKRVGVVNVPPSYPLRPVNGFIVGCMLTPPGQPLVEPPEAQADLDDYQVDLQAPGNLRRTDPDYETRAVAYLEGLREQTVRRAAASIRLLHRWPVDLLCVLFYAPDRVQHRFWPELAEGAVAQPVITTALRDVYGALDEALGALVAEAGPEATVIVVSDHGFASKPAHAVRLNRWLADQGLLCERLLWRARRKLARRLGSGSDDGLAQVLALERTRAWSETLEPGTAGIWVHATDRYPLGCVGPGREYEDVRGRIVEGLRALRGPGAEPVFRSVDRREDIYHGPHVNQAPDVVAVCAERFGVVVESLRRDLRGEGLFGPFDELGFSGAHDPDGIYLFAGPTIAARGRHQTYPIESIAPTALHLLGLPVPASMEGPVCTTVFSEEFLRGHPVRTSADDDGEAEPAGGWRSADDEALIEDRLRALGYLG